MLILGGIYDQILVSLWTGRLYTCRNYYTNECAFDKYILHYQVGFCPKVHLYSHVYMTTLAKLNFKYYNASNFRKKIISACFDTTVTSKTWNVMMTSITSERFCWTWLTHSRPWQRMNFWWGSVWTRNAHFP